MGGGAICLRGDRNVLWDIPPSHHQPRKEVQTPPGLAEGLVPERGLCAPSSPECPCVCLTAALDHSV